MPDEATYRRRLVVYTAARFGGVAIFLLGVVIAYSSLVRPGGWPQAGATIAIFGVIDSLIAPRLIKRMWDREDANRS